MPVPGKNETQKEFISRCIPMVIKEGNAKDNKQAAAICFNIWRREKGESALSDEELLEKIKAEFERLSKSDSKRAYA